MECHAIQFTASCSLGHQLREGACGCVHAFGTSGLAGGHDWLHSDSIIHLLSQAQVYNNHLVLSRLSCLLQLLQMFHNMVVHTMGQTQDLKLNVATEFTVAK